MDPQARSSLATQSLPGSPGLVTPEEGALDLMDGGVGELRRRMLYVQEEYKPDLGHTQRNVLATHREGVNKAIYG